MPYVVTFDKLGYVLSKIELEPFLEYLSSVSIAELEAKEALAVKVRDSHLCFRRVVPFSHLMLQLVTLAPLNFAKFFNTRVYMFRKELGQVLIPFMVKYLERTESSSYSHTGFFPNENFARYLLRLFMIWLRPDGSPVHTDGKEVPACGTVDVVHLPRVITGFVNLFHENRIDPLVVYTEVHDVYPKVDIDGQSVGDGFLPCDDVGFFLSMNNDGYRGEKEGTLTGGFFENTGAGVTR